MPGLSVIHKVAMVMAAVAEGGRPTLTEIARRTTLPLSTTHRLIAELDLHGLLVREGATYRVGTVGTAAAPELPALAAGVLEDLARICDAPVRLAVRRGCEVAVTARCAPGAGATPAAQRLPAHASAAGKALLAYAPAAVVDAVLQAGLPRFTPATITSTDVLRRSLAHVRLTRVAVSRGENVPGHDAVATPVFGPGGHVVGALEMSADHLPADLRAVRAALMMGASCLSRHRAQEAGPALRDVGLPTRLASNAS